MENQTVRPLFDALRGGLDVARRRGWLLVLLFFGEGLSQLVTLAWVPVLLVALGLALSRALAVPGLAGLPELLVEGVRVLLNPRMILGLGGALVICSLVAFGLGAFLRSGVLASLSQTLRPPHRFRWTDFFRGGMRIFDRVAFLVGLEALAPWCGLVFCVVSWIPTAPAVLRTLTSGAPLPGLSILLLTLGASGGALLALALFGWANLALAEVALRPSQPISVALGQSIRLLGHKVPELLGFGLLLLLFWTLPWLGWLFISTLAGSLGQQGAAALGSGLLQMGLELGFTLFFLFLSLATQAAWLILFLRLRPELAEEQQLVGWLDGSLGLAQLEADGAASPGGADAAEGVNRAGLPEAGLARIDPANVFRFDELHAAPVAPPSVPDGGVGRSADPVQPAAEEPVKPTEELP